MISPMRSILRDFVLMAEQYRASCSRRNVQLNSGYDDKE